MSWAYTQSRTVFSFKLSPSTRYSTATLRSMDRGPASISTTEWVATTPSLATFCSTFVGKRVISGKQLFRLVFVGAEVFCLIDHAAQSSSQIMITDRFIRESSDHASFNSWDRQVYMFDLPDGSSAVRKVPNVHFTATCFICNLTYEGVGLYLREFHLCKLSLLYGH